MNLNECIEQDKKLIGWLEELQKLREMTQSTNIYLEPLPLDIVCIE